MKNPHNLADDPAARVPLAANPPATQVGLPVRRQCQPPDPAVEASLKILQILTGHRQPRDFSVRFWEGSVWEPESGNRPQFTLLLQHPGALRKMFWPPNDVALGEVYLYDDFDVEGDIHAFFAFVKGLKEPKRGLRERLGLAWRLLRLPASHKPRLGRQPN